MKGPDSYLFRTVVRFAFFIINVLAVYLLLRGHNLPGGGFIGGLASAIALLLLSLAIGVEEVTRVILLDPVRVAAAGVLLALLTGLGPLVAGGGFLAHAQAHVSVPLLGEWHVGTPLVFDLGVYLAVVGVTSKIVFVLMKSTQRLEVFSPEERARYCAIREVPIETAGDAVEPAERAPAPEPEVTHAN